jgi:uncharacterized Zn finger protein
MEVVTDRKDGLFPLPGEMSFHCSCPDSARMCKHVAAVLYGIGARLDAKPELLFTLRGVNHEELIEADAEKAVTAATSRGKSKRLAADEISAVFGIEIDAGNTDASSSSTLSNKRPRKAAAKNVQAKKTNGEAKVKKIAKASGKVKKSVADKIVKKPAVARKEAKGVSRKRKPRELEVICCSHDKGQIREDPEDHDCRTAIPSTRLSPRAAKRLPDA